MTSEQQELKERFLEPETRCGFYVDSNRKALWKVQLDILERILAICEKHHLRISLMAGSLLGAIRHGGFIPWDDDFDVFLPREDYNLFLRFAELELDEGFVLQTQKTDPGNLEPFARVRKEGTAAIIVSNARQGLPSHMGIFVDIYPFNYYPATAHKFSRILTVTKIIWWIRYYTFSRCPPNPGKRLLVKRILSRFAYHLFGKRILFHVQEKVLGCAKSGALGFALFNAILDDKDIKRAVLPADIFDNILMLDFEYLKVPVISCFESYLTHFYGNWRIPVQGSSVHGGLIFDAYKSYKEILVDLFGYDVSKL